MAVNLDARNGVYNFKESDVISGNVLENDAAGMDVKLYLRAFDGEKVLAKVKDYVTDVSGTYGTFHVKADGSFTYTLSETAKKGLYAGTTLTESLNYKISNGSGGTDVASLKLNIAGETTKPVVVDDSWTITEGSKAVHNVLANDIAGENGQLFLRSSNGTSIGAKQGLGQITDVEGEHGTFHFSPDGNFTYDLDPTVAKTLNTGQSLTETLKYYKVSDGAGNTDVGVITLKIDGVTDAPAKTAVLFDFEDRPDAQEALPSDYHGFRFTSGDRNTYVMHEDTYKAEFPGSGYENGSIGDGSHVAFTPDSQSPTTISKVNGDNFDFDLVYLSSAWSESQSVTINAYDDDGTLSHTKTVSISDKSATFVDVDWKDIDRLEFVQETGSNNDPWDAHIVIDNLSLLA